MELAARASVELQPVHINAGYPEFGELFESTVTDDGGNEVGADLPLQGERGFVLVEGVIEIETFGGVLATAEGT